MNPFPKGTELMLDGSTCANCGHLMDNHMLDSYCLDCHPVDAQDVCFPDEESPQLEAAKKAINMVTGFGIAMILGYAFGDAKVKRRIRKIMR